MGSVSEQEDDHAIGVGGGQLWFEATGRLLSTRGFPVNSFLSVFRDNGFTTVPVDLALDLVPAVPERFMYVDVDAATLVLTFGSYVERIPMQCSSAEIRQELGPPGERVVALVGEDYGLRSTVQHGGTISRQRLQEAAVAERLLAGDVLLR